MLGFLVPLGSLLSLGAIPELIVDEVAMTDNVVNSKDYFHFNPLISGDNYDVTVVGGVYELVTRATSYGTGITVSRRMPDGTTYVSERAPITADGSVLLTLTAGFIRFGSAAAGTGYQVWFGRCDKF